MTILIEYSNLNNIFLVENVAKFLKYTGINDHIIKLKEDKQQLFGLIYSREPVELEILKTYIKINLANNFIWPSNCLTKASTLFDWKSDRNFRFYVNYWDFNNIIIKN